MDFKNMEIRKSYISCGENDIASALINPALRISKFYRRSIGFFSSSVFDSILDGVVNLVRNEGVIRIVASPRLSEEDINAIRLGYLYKNQIIGERITSDFIKAIDELDDRNLKLLADLIAKGVIDMKIAVTKGVGMYHDKLGILSDHFGNDIVFFGSSNESKSGYEYNYEKIRVVRSWVESEYESVIDEINEFQSLWEGTNSFVDVSTFNEAAKSSILEVIKSRNNSTNDEPVKLRKYQEDAIRNWKNNGYRGFFVMATGTGKTWTAIYSAKELIKYKKAMIVVCAPYKHLIKQWAEDLELVFPKANIVMISSENDKWENELSEEIIRNKYDVKSQIIIISTIDSFNLERFNKIINKAEGERLLIVDEAHRFTKRPEYLSEKYSYMIGLSATPNNGKNIQKGEDLINFFGGMVFSLTIEEAMRNKFLVPYTYHPIFVQSTEEEEEDFRKYTANMASCFKNGSCIDKDKLVINHRNRLRTIAMASEKIEKIDYILEQIKEKDHLVVYCGDGKLFDNDLKEMRHIQFIKRKLNDKGYKASQFTASENMKTRMQLVDSFNKNDISALAAIRCLDEGINIPSIKSALILSSNDDYKEFVQRRGRILRTFTGKVSANIYDVIVLPSNDSKSFAQIELRRYLEFAKLSDNNEILLDELNSLLDQYQLCIDEIEINTELIEEEIHE